jgi:hypothetical protein
MRTIKARELKAGLKRIEKGIHTIGLEMDHIQDDVKITFKPRKRPGPVKKPAAGNVLEGETGPVPRPKDPFCRVVKVSPVTAGEIYDWLWVMQRWVDVCRIATRALGRDYVINPRRR